uniref:Uncharacterized protein n=1 Tax=Picea sitchensis TaxID=3332 RepID=D5AB45_PICSI|nr:unknown [Picea sitchensis]
MSISEDTGAESQQDADCASSEYNRNKTSDVNTMEIEEQQFVEENGH